MAKRKKKEEPQTLLWTSPRVADMFSDEDMQTLTISVLNSDDDDELMIAVIDAYIGVMAVDGDDGMSVLLFAVLVGEAAKRFAESINEAPVAEAVLIGLPSDFNMLSGIVFEAAQVEDDDGEEEAGG